MTDKPTNEISFHVLGEPKALKRHRSARVGNGIRQYDPSAGDKADFLAQARLFAPETPIAEPCMLTVTACFPRPKSHYRGGKPALDRLKPDAPHWHTKRPDADNLLKFIEDALNTVFWRDDSLICVTTINKIYAETPRIIITVQW